MAIDREMRQVVADAIDAFLKGTIDNFSLDDTIFSKKTDDMLCAEIAQQVWFFYDDTYKYLNNGKRKLHPSREAILKRWILILRSELQWSDFAQPSPRPPRFGGFGRFLNRILHPTKPKFGDNPYWPFSNANPKERDKLIAALQKELENK